MFRTLRHLFSGIVLIAAVLTGIVYLWLLNSTTIYERVESPEAEQSLSP